MRRITLVLALAVLAVAPAAATASAKLVSPVGGRVVTTYPLLRWTLPKGERNEVVYIARKPARAASGEFVTENLDDTAPMTGRAGSHRTTNGLYAGTHYWLVVTRNADFEQQYSRIGRFRVAPSLSVTRARLTPGATAGSADFRMRLKTNARTLRVTVKVVQGGKVVQTFARTSKVLNPGVWGSRKVRWVPSSAVVSGNPAQLRVTYKAGSRTAHSTLDVIAP